MNRPATDAALTQLAELQAAVTELHDALTALDGDAPRAAEQIALLHALSERARNAFSHFETTALRQ